MAYSIRLTAIPEQAIAYIRERGPLSDLPAHMERLMNVVRAAGMERVGPVMARYFSDRSKIDDLDYEVAVPILPRADGSVPDAVGEARTAFVPAHHAFVTQHGGPHHEAHMGYTALTEELNAIGYAIAGPATEVYEKGPLDCDDPSCYVTELRLPIAR